MHNDTEVVLKYAKSGLDCAKLLDVAEERASTKIAAQILEAFSSAATRIIIDCHRSPAVHAHFRIGRISKKMDCIHLANLEIFLAQNGRATDACALPKLFASPSMQEQGQSVKMARLIDSSCYIFLTWLLFSWTRVIPTDDSPGDSEGRLS